MAAKRSDTLKAHFNSQQEPRPIFTALNGDNSWLLSFPRPIAERESTGKAYYHIVHDPWLNGPEVQFSSWLISLTLSSPAAVPNGTGVEHLVQEIESFAAEAGIIASAPKPTANEESPIDAILLNFHYGDHLHVPTLLTFSPSIPVFTTTEGALTLNPLNHFTTITTYSDLSPSPSPSPIAWQTLHPSPVLPSYLTLFRIKGHHELNFLTALIWSPRPGKHEAILYSPHGLRTSTPALQSLLHDSAPEFQTLALLHGLKESWTWGWQTTFGVKSGLELFRESEARYWVRTHDDRLSYGGVVWWLVSDIFRTVEWGLGQERLSEGKAQRVKDVVAEGVGNGVCFVLV